VRIEPTSLPGVMVVELELLADERGSFARTYCAETFARAGLKPTSAQCSIAHNPARHTLRGMHYQTASHPEDKLVRCSRGAVYDVALDLRPDSPTWGCWLGVELQADEPRALYIPTGVAHGYLTLEPDTELTYQMSAPYRPGATKGVRYDDPAFAIDWPAAPEVISERDAAYPLAAARPLSRRTTSRSRRRSSR